MFCIAVHAGAGTAVKARRDVLLQSTNSNITTTMKRYVSFKASDIVDEFNDL